jgi:uncharacterized protein YeaO (DUF488 family)
MGIKIKRIYDPPAATDGKRVLVDRLWPRGVSKERAQVDLWLKEVTPTPELRKWYGHKPERHEEFKHLYQQELATDPEHIKAVELLRKMAATEVVTLLYAAKDTTCNHAIVLLDWLSTEPSP